MNLYLVRFTRTFTGGTLNGISMDDSITQPSLDEAKRTMALLRRNSDVKRPAGGGSPYRLSDFRIERF
jgi:hypothetical protein